MELMTVIQSVMSIVYLSKHAGFPTQAKLALESSWST